LDVVGEAHHTVVIDDDDPLTSSSSNNNKHRFNAQLFASSHCWGRYPLLVRRAFDPNLLLNNHNDVDNKYDDNGNDEVREDTKWPSWKDVVEIATDEESESRIISHIPGDNSSFELDWGPLTKKDARSWCDKLSSSTLLLEPKAIGKTKRQTLVVNDVDRFYPPLADWMYDTFNFLPNWRMDDGQISLAEHGGGIGPHVDNYDVFLIQMSGTRTWQVGRRKISAQEERDRTIDGLDVRVLDEWGHVHCNEVSSEMQQFTLHAGDMLYLPPRVAHCGTSLSNDCMTLSVGCRAPSVSEMVSKLAERLSSSMDESALRRYTDSDMLLGLDSSGMMMPGELTHDAKEMARKLVLDSLSLLINNDEWWDEFFGRYVTEQKRVRSNYPIPLTDSSIKDDDEWNDAHSTVSSVMAGKGFLYQAEGIAFAYSCISSNLHIGRTINRFFVNGEMWQSKSQSNKDDWSQIFQIVANNRRLDRLSLLGRDGNDNQEKVQDDILLAAEAISFLEELVSAGFLYGAGS
jgi:50S ribosomal protein L16 3-hydroxylase